MRSILLVGFLTLCACGDDAPTTQDALVDTVDRPDAPSTPSGCGRPTAFSPGQTVVRTMTHGGRERSFRVRLPAGYTGAPVPLVFVLHGGGGWGEQIETNQAAFNPIGEREGFALVYPDGIPRDAAASGPLALRTWNAGGCCLTAVEENVDDVGFLTAALDEVEAGACIDTDRVYFTGMSNGAMMSYRMACERADRIAAIAPVAGSLVVACSPSRPVAVMHVHGTDDARVLYDGGTGCGSSMVQSESVATVVARWAAWNGCTGSPSTTFSEGNGTCVSSGECTAGTVLCTVDGGSHSWPGGTADATTMGQCEGGEQSTTFMASEAIWRFFAANPRTP